MNEFNDRLLYCNTGIAEIVRSEVGPTRAVGGDSWTWTEHICGDISKSSKIRIGIKAFTSPSVVFILFAEENSVDTKGITFCFQGYDWNFPGIKNQDAKWADNLGS